MPIYEYKCDGCEHKLEVLQKMSEEPLKFCPECGKESLRKLVSAAAFRLSGSGWYETDFKDKKQQKNLHKSDNKQASEGDGKKSEAATQTKSDSASPASTSTKKPPETPAPKASSSGKD